MCNTPSARLELCPAVGLENMACHPTTGVGEPVDRQVGLIVALKGMRVPGMVNQDGLQFAVSHEVSPQLPTFSSHVMYARSGILFYCRPVSSILDTCWGLYPLP